MQSIGPIAMLLCSRQDKPVLRRTIIGLPQSFSSCNGTAVAGSGIGNARREHFRLSLPDTRETTREPC